MKQYSPQQILQILELNYPIMQLLGQCRSFEQGVACLNKFKEVVSKQRKTMAKKYHPDLDNGGEERMKEINNAVDFVKKLRFIPPKPKPVVIYSYSMSFGDSGSTSSSYYQTSGSYF